MLTRYDASLAKHEKASVPRSSSTSTHNVESNSLEDLERMISDTFDRLYASWDDKEWTEREGEI